MLPVNCTLDDTCYIQNYVDHDPTSGASNFLCGPHTYDTHKGTDFALNSLTAMEAGIDVLAAASGVVQGVRNDMRDVLYTPDLDAEIDGRDCGNGWVIAMKAAGKHSIATSKTGLSRSQRVTWLKQAQPPSHPCSPMPRSCFGRWLLARARATNSD